MDLMQQIDAGKLRCLRTGHTLRRDNGQLVSDGGYNYSLIDGKVPVLFKSAETIAALLAANPTMEKEYEAPGLYHRLRKLLYKDYSSHQFHAVFDRAIRALPDDAVLLSVGGGPVRDTANMTTLNIGPFHNVDIVGDAHDLPYHDNTVDAVYHSALLEHLQEPVIAVREMKRVLRSGGQLLSVIPFMQAYHGYPDHYQNYTLSGHEYLYRSHGFRIVSSGACLGPVVALTTLNARFFLEYLPPVLNQLIGRPIQLLGVLLRPLDRLLEKSSKRHIIASATYVLAEKVTA